MKKFRRSGVVQSNGVYERKSSLPRNQEILTDGALRALNKAQITPNQNYGKGADLMRVDFNADAALMPKSTITGKDSTLMEDMERYKSYSKCSNYDTVAMPCSSNSTAINK